MRATTVRADAMRAASVRADAMRATSGRAASEGGEAVRRRPSGEPPPIQRELDRGTMAVALCAVGFGLVWAVAATSGQVSESILIREGEMMQRLGASRPPAATAFVEPLYTLLYSWGVPVIGWLTIIALAAYQRWRHILAVLAALITTTAVAAAVRDVVQRPRPLGIEILGPWDGFAHPGLFVAALTTVLVAAVCALVPAGRRRPFFGGALVVAALASAAQVYVGAANPSDVVAALLLGAALSAIVMRVVAPDEAFPVSYAKHKAAHLDLGGARGEAIRSAVADQLGLQVEAIEPVGLAGSAGSTPMRLTIADAAGGEQRYVFAKLLADTHLRADRFYKLTRTLLYGRLEDEYRFSTVRRMAQQEDYISLRMREAGVRVPLSYGLVELTPEKEYLVVTEFMDGYSEIADAEVDEPVIDSGLEVVRRLWDGGLAHRDVKPANVMVGGGEVSLIDTGFGEMRPSPWRQAVDLANMMLVLALRSEPEIVYDRARSVFSDDEIAEAFAASKGVTIPTQLRSHLKQDGRGLLERFRELAPERDPVAIQRWSARRLGLLVAVLLIASLGLLFGLELLSLAGLLP